jgi:hypothetical protein
MLSHPVPALVHDVIKANGILLFSATGMMIKSDSHIFIFYLLAVSASTSDDLGDTSSVQFRQPHAMVYWQVLSASSVQFRQPHAMGILAGAECQFSAVQTATRDGILAGAVEC